MEFVTSGAKGRGHVDFGSLPIELVDLILAILPLEAKKIARLVCSAWNRIIEWRLRYKFPLSVDTLADFMAREYKVKELILNLPNLTLPDALSPTVKATLRSVQKLKLSAVTAENSSRSGQHLFYGVKKAKELVFVDYKGIRSILRNCNNLQELEFDCPDLEYFETSSILDLRSVKLQHLTVLKLRTHSQGTTVLVLALLRLQTPSLHTAVFQPRILTNVTWDVYLGFQRFMVRNYKTLKSLSLGEDSITALRSMSFMEVEDEEQEIVPGLGKLNLESLEINRLDFYPELPFLNQVLKHQNSLKELTITNKHTVSQQLPACLLRNRWTLTKLSLTIYSSGSEFDFSVLRQCKSLEIFVFWSNHSTNLEPGNVPRSVRCLVWKAPLSQDWFEPQASTALPYLQLMTLAGYALAELSPRDLDRLCSALFGTVENKTNFEELTLWRPCNTNVQAAFELRVQGYSVEMFFVNVEYVCISR